MNTLINFGSTLHPAPGTSEARRVTDWRKLSNDNLKFALDTLSLHHSPFEFEVANEIERRIQAGQWLDINEPTPPLTEAVPSWLHWFPFCLLWKQGRL